MLQEKYFDNQKHFHAFKVKLRLNAKTSRAVIIILGKVHKTLRNKIYIDVISPFKPIITVINRIYQQGISTKLFK